MQHAQYQVGTLQHGLVALQRVQFAVQPLQPSVKVGYGCVLRGYIVVYDVLAVLLFRQYILVPFYLLLDDGARTVVLAAFFHYGAKFLVLYLRCLDVLPAVGEHLAQFLYPVACQTELLLQFHARAAVLLGLGFQHLHSQERGHDAFKGLETVHLRRLVGYGGELLVEDEQFARVYVQFGVQLLVSV